MPLVNILCAGSSWRARSPIGAIAIVLLSLECGATAQSRKTLLANERADVYRLDITAGSRTAVTPTTGYGVVWVALTSGVVEADGETRTVRDGEAQRAGEGGTRVILHAPVNTAAAFVVVNVRHASQQLTVTASSSLVRTAKPCNVLREREQNCVALAPGGSIQDGSARNDTLIVAVSALELRDIWNLAKDEADGWRPNKPLTILLKIGDAWWMKPGMHRVTNVGRAPARFVAVEW